MKIIEKVAPCSPDIVGNRGYAWYVVALLTLAYTMSFVDRQVLNLLVDPIKRDLLLTDTQVSLLQGLAYMGAYVTMGPIFGRWADSGHRRTIIMVGVALWSSFTVLCGFSHGFWSLFISRAGVGAAEACLTPSAWSIISDYFRGRQLVRAMSLFHIAPFLGGGLALIFGGVILASMDHLQTVAPVLTMFSVWQLPFVLVGLPGIALAATMYSIREPARASIGGPTAQDRHFELREVFRFIWTGRAFFLRLYPGMSLIINVLYALPAWMPPYLIRHFGMRPADIGLEYGTLILIMGLAGVMAAPLFDRWLRSRGYVDTPVRIALISGAALTLISIALAFAPTYRVALALAGCATFFYTLPQTMVVLALQVSTPNRMRGVFASLYIFINQVMGLGVAPTVVAVLTDYVFRDPSKVGWSLAATCAVSATAATCLFWAALPHYLEAVNRAQQEDL
jgi:MFS family permease